MNRTVTRLLAVVFLAIPLPLLAADWPHWRGPARNGISDEPSGFRADQHGYFRADRLSGFQGPASGEDG